MKGLYKELIKAVFVDALWALGLSGLFSLIRVIFRGNVTRVQFLGGALVIFLFLFLDYIYNIIRTLILMKKDPIFKEMIMRTGMTWREYKKFKKTS